MNGTETKIKNRTLFDLLIFHYLIGIQVLWLINPLQTLEKQAGSFVNSLTQKPTQTADQTVMRKEKKTRITANLGRVHCC